MARWYGGLRIAWCINEDITRALSAGAGGASVVDWSLPEESDMDVDWTPSQFGNVEVEEDEVMEDMEDPFKRLSRSKEEIEESPSEESSGSDGAEEVSMFDSDSEEEWEEVVDNF
jgi:hypothetical protein